MIRILLMSGIFALTINTASAQMGGMGAATPTPEVDGETWIWEIPEKWYPFSKSSELKNDVFIFPTGQKPEKWKQMIQFEEFTSTLGVTQASQVYDLKTKNLKDCTLETIRENDEKGYSTIQWSESCPVDDEISVTLRKATVGNDRLYLASKVWKSEPKESEMEKWLAFLGQTYVCDGTQEHDCTPQRARGGGGGR